MASFIGNLEMAKAYVGNTELSKIFAGNSLIWEFPLDEYSNLGEGATGETGPTGDTPPL